MAESNDEWKDESADKNNNTDSQNEQRQDSQTDRRHHERRNDSYGERRYDSYGDRRDSGRFGDRRREPRYDDRRRDGYQGSRRFDDYDDRRMGRSRYDDRYFDDRRRDDRYDDRRRDGEWYDDRRSDRPYKRSYDSYDDNKRGAYDRRPRRTRADAGEPNETLGIFNLNFEATSEDVSGYIDEKVPELKGTYTVKLILNKLSGRSRGYGFITFDSVENATKAKDALEGGSILGYNYRIAFALDPQRNQTALKPEIAAGEEEKSE